jgi:hypothetical protein
MFPGVDLLIQRIIYILTILLMLIPSSVLAQNLTPSLLDDKKGIYAIVKDGQGEAVEGFLRLSSEELTVRTKENKERSIPVKYIKSITLEEIKSEVPGEDSKKQATYKVRLENSQEIYTLKKKYSFSLNTNLGLVTRTIDPEVVNNILNKETSPSGKTGNEKLFIQDKSVVFSLEFKF